MEEARLNSLSKPFDSLADQGRWDEYVALLCADGLSWWFNMEIPSLAAHLSPLRTILPGAAGAESRPAYPPIEDIPPRLAFLLETVLPVMSPERLVALYHAFIRVRDFEGAAAAAGAGIASIWDQGTSFDEWNPWSKRVQELLDSAENVSPLARASLLTFKGFVELLGLGDLNKLQETYRLQLSTAEKARSSSLLVFRAAVLGYRLLYSGDAPGWELLQFDSAPLLELQETSIVSKVYFQITLGLMLVSWGDILRGKAVLQEVVGHPLFDRLPPSMWTFGQCHHLLAAAFAGDAAMVEDASRAIRKRVIPEQNHFCHAFVHLGMSVAAIVLGEPSKALVYGREAGIRGAMCGSPLPERMAALPIGQALADLGKTDEALLHFGAWLEKWRASGFHMFAAAGGFEVANLLRNKGRIEDARRNWETASGLLPSGDHLPLFYRPPDFYAKLKTSLNPEKGDALSWTGPEEAAVRIEALGDLRVRIGVRTLFDRKWRGGRTKKLLKALLVHGGTKVSSDLLLDLLWPDKEGDLAQNALKVALSRLRRIGCDPDEEPRPWIVVRHRHVSLVKSLCFVDSLSFREGLHAALEKKDRGRMGLLIKALDLYSDDFLANDRSETWIIRHREELREAFFQGVLALAASSFETKNFEVAVPFLQRALEKDPTREVLYAGLMRGYLLMGYPSSAIRVFLKAAEALKRDLGIEPGPSLISLYKEASRKK